MEGGQPGLTTSVWEAIGENNPIHQKMISRKIIKIRPEEGCGEGTLVGERKQAGDI